MKKKAKLRPIPKFEDENNEREFWAKADTSQYFDFSKARQVVFPNLKLTKRPISLRISESLLAKIKMVANKKDIPYQTLMKQYLLKAINKELRAFPY